LCAGQLHAEQHSCAHEGKACRYYTVPLFSFLVVNVAVCMLLILMREFENDLLYIAFTPEFYASAARWQGIAFRSSDNPSLC